jgi:pimeloyl-ACP methyl ester carboxylesterase
MTERISSYQHDGLTFDVLDEGPIDGEVVVLLHGFPQLNTMWAPVAAGLHAAGYRTLAPNQRGYSPGARPKGRRPYTITRLVDDVRALVDVIGVPVHLVGHDWGAAVSWATVSRHPERFRSHVAVSVPHIGAYFKALLGKQLFKSWYMGMFNVPGLADRLLTSRRPAERLFSAFGMQPAPFERYWRDFGTDHARLRGGLAWYRAMALENPRNAFVKARVPSTMVWSDGDSALDRSGIDHCAEYVDAPYRLEVLSGSHWIPDEQPDELTRIILERISAS